MEDKDNECYCYNLRVSPDRPRESRSVRLGHVPIRPAQRVSARGKLKHTQTVTTSQVKRKRDRQTDR